VSRMILHGVVRPILSGSGFLFWLILAFACDIADDVFRRGLDRRRSIVVLLGVLVLTFLYGRRVIRLECLPDRPS